MKKIMALSFVSVTVAFVAFLCSGAQAAGPTVIEVDVFPYLGSLGSNATAVEQDLANKATVVCGSLGNVAQLAEINLNMQSVQTSNVNPKGVAGGPLYSSLLTFAYPRVTGSAKVTCKH